MVTDPKGLGIEMDSEVHTAEKIFLGVCSEGAFLGEIRKIISKA